MRRNLVFTFAAGGLLAAMAAASGAQTAPGGSFGAKYQARVTATQSEQPHWVTPVATVTPRLEQEMRADFVQQTNPKGYATWNYGNGKGLELIPFRRVELLFNLPSFFSHSQPGVKDGFGDVSFNSKFRFFARNEEHGNAIVTGFFAATIPTGKNANGSCCAVVTPTLAAGKGFGLLALTSTLGGSLPVTNAKGLGHTVIWNNVVQYRLARVGVPRFFWPEIEFNSSFFSGGSNDGKIATFATPGMIVGRLPLSHDADGKAGRLGLTFGVGEQIALTHFHTYNHGLILTARLPF
jgi:hypothetical protein